MPEREQAWRHSGKPLDVLLQVAKRQSLRAAPALPAENVAKIESDIFV
jgi:hypothetical protein